MIINIKQKGFTLLEVVIAIGILVMVGAVAVGASTRAINIGTYAKNRTRAQNLARSQIEGLKALRDTNYKASPQRPWNYDIPPGNIRTCVGFVKSNTNFKCIGEATRIIVDSTAFDVATRIESVDDDQNGNDNGNPNGKTDSSHGYPSGLDENLNMRRIIVTVTWSDPFIPDKNQKVELWSYLTNDKLAD
jgi:prepilin-type N-terminal cleavage/methylation domain-containing protein